MEFRNGSRSLEMVEGKHRSLIIAGEAYRWLIKPKMFGPRTLVRIDDAKKRADKLKVA